MQLIFEWSYILRACNIYCFLEFIVLQIDDDPFSLEFCHLKQTICAFRRQWWTTMDGRIKMQISP